MSRWGSKFLSVATDLRYFAVGWLGGNYAAFYVDICEVKGRSMQPSLDDARGDRVLVNKYGYPCKGLVKGCVYTLRNPNDPEKTIIKRLVGVGGERFERYGSHGPVTVPEGHIWVEGDNSAFSEDSRYYGPIPAGLVIGEAKCIIWPPTSVGSIPAWDVSDREYIDPPLPAFSTELCPIDDHDFPYQHPLFEEELAGELTEQLLEQEPIPSPLPTTQQAHAQAPPEGYYPSMPNGE